MVFNPHYSIGTEEFTDNLENFLKSLIAEFFGTFTLLFFGVSSCGQAGALYSMITIALAFGLALAAAVLFAFPISGGHVNPAVSITLLALGRLNLIRTLFYVVVQFLGAITGAFISRLLVNIDFKKGGHTTLRSSISLTQGFFIELIMTAFLVLVILASVAPHKPFRALGPLMIGFALVACCFSSGYYTGASLNPARTLATAIAANNFSDLWLYFVAPIVGGLCGGFVYAFVFEDPEEKETGKGNSSID